MISFKIFEEKTIAYLVSSIVPFLVFSIFLADLICVLSSLFFFFYLIKKKSSIFYKNIFFLIALIFYFLSLISSLFSGEILFSLKSSFPLIRIIIFIFLVSYLIEHNKYFLNIFYNFLKYTFIILIFHGIGQYVYETYQSQIGIIDFEYIRLNLPFSDEEKIGSFLVRLYGLLIAIYFLKNNFNKSENIFLIIITMFVSFIIFLSGERSSLFFLILFLSVCIFFLDINLKFKIYFALSFLIIFISILLNSSKLSNRIIFDKNNQLNISSNKGELVIFTSQHTAHFLSAFKMFKDKPLMGQGPRMFRLLCSDTKFSVEVNGKKSCSTHPHNTYIQLLAETGFIGAFLFSLGFFNIVFFFFKQFLSKLFFKKKKINNYSVVVNALALIIFWPFSPSGNFFNNWILIIYAFPISFYINDIFKNNIFKKN